MGAEGTGRVSTRAWTDVSEPGHLGHGIPGNQANRVFPQRPEIQPGSEHGSVNQEIPAALDLERVLAFAAEFDDGAQVVNEGFGSVAATVRFRRDGVTVFVHVIARCLVVRVVPFELR
jgi:hypothetical protein